MRLKEMVVRERPRERLRAVGAAALSEAELLALLLRTGNKGENVLGSSEQTPFTVWS
jgi:DNA repair protein RadC